MPILYQGKVIAGNDSGGVSDIQTKLEGIPGQVVGFDVAGNATAIQGWSNPNLLDNWYFGNPVNQRGKTEYNSYSEYSIDRWYTGATAKVTGDAIEFVRSVTTGNPPFRQFIDDVSRFASRIITFSALVKTNVANTFCVSIGVDRNETRTVIPVSSDYVLVSDTRQCKSSISGLYVSVQNYGNTLGGSTTVGDTCYIKAAKLELGAQQTLAHKEGDTWVLNEIPDYATELAKCQRYFYRLKVAPYERVGYGTGPANQFVMSVPIPEMRSSPTIQASNVVWHTSPNDLQVTNISSFSSPIGREAQILCTTSSTSTDVIPFMRLRNMTADTIGYIDFNADL